MPRRTKAGSQSCTNEEEKMEVRRGPWTLEEDSLLIHYIANHGGGHWNLLAKSAGLKRTGKSCRLRWLNYLKPDIKRGNLTTQEQILILQLHSQWGNRWSKIAQHLPGRTDNEIKNFWRTRVQKRARQLKIDANSSKFFDAISFFWTPTLVQKVEENGSSSSLSSPSNHHLSAASMSSSPHEHGNSVQDNAPQDARESNYHVDCSGYVMEDYEISGANYEISESDQWVVLDSIEDNLWNMENM